MKTMTSLLLYLTFISLGLCLSANGRKIGIHNMNIDEGLLKGPMDSISKVTVNFTSILHVCDDKFLSICIDSDEVASKWDGFDFSSPKLKNMAAALSPINIRIGGTDADFIVFDPSDKEEKLLGGGHPKLTEQEKGVHETDSVTTLPQYPMPATMWETMTSFFSSVGWDLLFDLNVCLWKDGAWDSSNAELLLNYSSAKGIPIPNFQLGNEPNGFPGHLNVTITPEELVKDIKILKNLLAKYPMYKDSGVYGPDVTRLGDPTPGSSTSYLQGFVAAGGADVVTEIALHYYYLNGDTAKAEDFLKVETLDSFKRELDTAYNITRSSSKTVKLRLTETSSCYHSGASGLSDKYLAGFLWLDKLGIAAQYGITHVFRQTFYGGNYALLSPTLDPNPDFFLSVLYKRLVGGPVFNVSVQPDPSNVRVYAHCARKDKYPAGSLTLYYLNMKESSVTLSMSQFQGKYLDLYLLTPGDSDGLTSSYVKLNGEKLVMQGSMLPLRPPKTQQGDVTVESRSFGFVVVPNANVTLCM